MLMRRILGSPDMSYFMATNSPQSAMVTHAQEPAEKTWKTAQGCDWQIRRQQRRCPQNSTSENSDAQNRGPEDRGPQVGNTAVSSA